MILGTLGEHRRIVAAIAWAVRPYLDCDRGPTRAALELARNASAVLLAELDLDAEQLIAEMIRHRVRHGWLACGDVRSAAHVGAAAWGRVAGLGSVAA